MIKVYLVCLMLALVLTLITAIADPDEPYTVTTEWGKEMQKQSMCWEIQLDTNEDISYLPVEAVKYVYDIVYADFK